MQKCECWSKSPISYWFFFVFKAMESLGKMGMRLKVSYTVKSFCAREFRDSLEREWEERINLPRVTLVFTRKNVTRTILFSRFLFFSSNLLISSLYFIRFSGFIRGNKNKLFSLVGIIYSLNCEVTFLGEENWNKWKSRDFFLFFLILKENWKN